MTASQQTLEFHEVANLFPFMSSDEYASLVDDIDHNGQLEPIWIYEGKIIDGRNRYKACCDLGIDPIIREWHGTGSLVSFVVSLNLKRRHMDSSQKSMLALEVEKYLAGEAKERQRLSGGDKKSALYSDLKSVVQDFEQPINANDNKSIQKAADIVGTNRQYVSDAKRVQRDAPELIERVKQGDMHVQEAAKLAKLPEHVRADILSRIDNEGAKDVKEAQKAIQKEQTIAAIASMAVVEKAKHNVAPGEWWQLGRHKLYCGNTADAAFISQLPQTTFAFADPPYNANAAEWDNGFTWQHDYLISKAETVIVTPGISAIFDFARLTTMPYKWSIACWIDNGMTRGAMGFGNWMYAAVFSHGSIHHNSQDIHRVSIDVSTSEETSHKGRKPLDYIVWLLNTFASYDAPVIDPFLGSGTTLFAAEATRRVCVGGELNPLYCADIIARWEHQTGQTAQRSY